MWFVIAVKEEDLQTESNDFESYSAAAFADRPLQDSREMDYDVSISSNPMDLDVSIPNFDAHDDGKSVNLRSDRQLETTETMTAVSRSTSDSPRQPPSFRSHNGGLRMPTFNRSRDGDNSTAAVPTTNNRMCSSPADSEPAVLVSERTLLTTC